MRLTIAGGGNSTIEVDTAWSASKFPQPIGDAQRRQRISVDLAGRMRRQRTTPVQARKTVLDDAARARLRRPRRDSRPPRARPGARSATRPRAENAGRAAGPRRGVRGAALGFAGAVVMNSRADGLSYYSWATFDSACRAPEPVFAIGETSAATPDDGLRDDAREQHGFFVERDGAGIGGYQQPRRCSTTSTLAAPSGPCSTGMGSTPIACLNGFTGVPCRLRRQGGELDQRSLDRGGPGRGFAVVVISTTYPDAASARRMTLESYGDRTSIAREELARFGGGTAPRSSLGSPTGTSRNACPSGQDDA